jgi:uncharacterized protein (DUF58 family)
VSPTPPAAIAVALMALAAFAVPWWLAAALVVAVLVAALADALSVREPPALERRAPHLLARGVRGRLDLALPRHGEQGEVVRLRQPGLPDVRFEPAQAAGAELHAAIVPRRRGRHVLPRPAVRLEGALRLGAWTHELGAEEELLVYPDIVEAARLASAVRHARFRDAGLRRRGPLGLGTEFESIREYLPDDDVRQVNWRATARTGRPMTNQFRIEQDRDVICLVDAGRLMAAPLGELTRLDAALDAAIAVAAVADELNDRAGALAFDTEVLRRVAPRRNGSRAIVQALFDVEPTGRDSDYELAFRSIGGSKRAFVLVLTDLLEPVAAQPLLEAVPILARRHVVAVASVRDPDLDRILRRPPETRADVATAAVAADVLDARRLVVARLRRAGAQVVEASPKRLPAACVDAYLRSKSRGAL